MRINEKKIWSLELLVVSLTEQLKEIHQESVIVQTVEDQHEIIFFQITSTHVKVANSSKIKRFWRLLEILEEDQLEIIFSSNSSFVTDYEQ